MKKKILIIYASYGSGHKTVATSIYNYLKNKEDYEVYLMNIMDYSNKIGKFSEKAFDLNIKYSCSFLFTCLYKMVDHKMTTILYKEVFKSLFVNEELNDVMLKINPDLIIATHFFGTTLGSMYHKKVMCILTDYKSHELWEKEKNKVACYVVANYLMKKDLIIKGIAKKKIYPLGIPVGEEFNIFDISKTKALKKIYNVDNNKKTILFFAGGSLGSSKVFKSFKRLVLCNYNCNIIFVCGKNLNLKNKCVAFVSENSLKNIMVIGFSREVSKLLNISDFVITKPGGLSVTECLQMKKPLILIKGNGGQELYNAQYVCDNKYGVYAKNDKLLCEYVKIFLNDKNEEIQENIADYKQNNSMKKVCKMINKII